MPIFHVFVCILIVQNYIFLAYTISHPFLDVDLKNKFELFLSCLCYQLLSNMGLSCADFTHLSMEFFQ